MRTVYVQELMRLPLGKQGENGAARIVWQGLAARYQALYGAGVFALAAKRCGDAEAYPVAVSTEGVDVVWLVQAADVASPGSGSCELTYTVDGVVAKSQTWSTYVAASISGDTPGEPPEEPARAWFAAVQAQMGNLDDLTTRARTNLVAAVNEAAKTGSGGGVDIDLGITGAAAGQVAKVKAVDADGKPTAWEPADLPSGGGGDWVLAGSVTAESAGLALKVSNIHAKHILVSLYASCDDASNMGYYIGLNDVVRAQHAGSLPGNSNKHLWAVEFDLLAAGDENYIYSRVWPNETHHTNTSNNPVTIMNTTTLAGTMWYKVGISEFNSVTFASTNGVASAGNIMNVWYR